MISDFVYPGLGGVETHIHQLSSCLVEMGYKVVIFSHSRKDRIGVRFLANGVKAYYYGYPIMAENCTWSQGLACFPVLREILIRENIDLVHCHQAPSSMTLECIGHCQTLGYPVVFTDHSLFGFNDAGSIHVNKCLKFWLAKVNACISVSYTNKENICLRAAINPRKVYVIPNALDAELFTPGGAPGPLRNVEWVNVVMISRLTYRKGTDLLVQAIPIIARRFTKVRFIIGGDGPKMILLEEMKERFALYDRVQTLGGLTQQEVRATLRKGHVFLNASLTEAFCIGILEAACSGLFVVCTNVGGVTEVLPPHLVTFVKCTPQALADGATAAINRVFAGELDPWKIHNEVAPMYKWEDVASRVSRVYDAVIKEELQLYPKTVYQWAMSNNYSNWAAIYVYLLQMVIGLLWSFYRPCESIGVAVSIDGRKAVRNDPTFNSSGNDRRRDHPRTE